MTQLLTYVSKGNTARNSSELFLSVEEAKPLLSLINKIQLAQRKQLVCERSLLGHCEKASLSIEIDSHLKELRALLYEDTKANYAKKESE